MKKVHVPLQINVHNQILNPQHEDKETKTFRTHSIISTSFTARKLSLLLLHLEGHINMSSYSPRSGKTKLLQFFSVSISIAACILLLRGYLLQRTLQHGKECEMTWSVVRFVSLPQPLDDDAHSERIVPGRDLPYRLLKFTDGRDRRYKHLANYSKRDENDGNTFEVNADVNWCKSGNVESVDPGHIVLFVPGHEGQYQQARSLGAHGLNLTRHSSTFPRSLETETVDELWDGDMNAYAEDLLDFVYDVYTIDFNGEGGALHGSRLCAQSEFVTQTLERLSQECGHEYADQITVVAHSLGGIVARKAVLDINEKRRQAGDPLLVRNVITLASPHSFIPLAVDSSVHNFHKALIQQERFYAEKNTSTYSLLSLSGGLRDELIPPLACEVVKEKAVSLLASDAMSSEASISYVGSRLGMDHRAIVWCHGLLSVIRTYIHASVIEEASSEEMVSNVMSHQRSWEEDCDFPCQNNMKDHILVDEYGSLGAFAIKTSSFSNLPALTVLYFLNGAISFFYVACSYQNVKSIADDRIYLNLLLIPFLSSAIFISFLDELSIGFGSTIILAHNAMNVYSIIQRGVYPALSWLLQRLFSPQNSKNPSTSNFAFYLKEQLQIVIISCTSFFIALSTFACVYKRSFLFNALSVGSILFVLLVLVLIVNIVHLGCWPRTDHCYIDYQRSLASILIIIFPLLALGKVVFALSMLTDLGQSKAYWFIKFENREWDKFCSNSYGLVCINAMLKHDLIRFSVGICLPIYFLIMWIRCRPLKQLAIGMKKER